VEGTAYDRIAEWYSGAFRPSLSASEASAVERLLGPGDGRCLDIGCGTGVAAPVVAALGWTVIGVDVSERLLDIARSRGIDVVNAPAEALPFEDASFDSAVSIWTHTDVQDFGAAMRAAARVLRSGAPFVYVGGHPCFVGPHSRFVGAEGVPVLHPGYRRAERYQGGPAISPEGLRAKVGAMHLPLGRFLQAFLEAGLRIERFEELEEREYPYLVALLCRR
jgi:SAM-dependent methyltransferase